MVTAEMASVGERDGQEEQKAGGTGVRVSNKKLSSDTSRRQTDWSLCEERRASAAVSGLRQHSLEGERREKTNPQKVDGLPGQGVVQSSEIEKPLACTSRATSQ